MSGVASEVEDIWTTAKGLLNVVESVVSAILDPLVNKLMQEAVTPIIGDTDTINKASEVWRDAALALQSMRDDHNRTVTQLMTTFDGQTAQACSTRMTEHANKLHQVSDQMKSTSDYLDNASLVISTVAGIIKGLIKSFIEMMAITILAAVVTSFFDFGASMAAAEIAADGEYGYTFTRITAAGEQIAAKFEEIEQAFARFSESESTIVRWSAKLGEKEMKGAKETLRLSHEEGSTFDTVKSAAKKYGAVPIYEAAKSFDITKVDEAVHDGQGASPAQ